MNKKNAFLRGDVYILTSFNTILTTFNLSQFLKYASLSPVEWLRYVFFYKLKIILGVFLVWLI